MLEFYFSLAGLYLFIFGGFLLKKIFTKDLQPKTITITNVYFFQPILAFWGFTKAPLSGEIFGAGLFFFITCLATVSLCYVFLIKFLPDNKQKALLIFSGTNGNSGNMGIPLSGALFGPIGIVTATMINVFNIFWNVTFGVYFFARGKFSIKKSILQIFTMPLLWAGIIGIFLNLNGILFPEKIQNVLEMGAHASIALQLFLLGIFWADIPMTHFSVKLNIWLNFQKFILLPVIGLLFFIILSHPFFGENFIFSKTVQSVILLQLMMPMAVNNSNLATLYDCLAHKVSEGVLTTTGIFLFICPLLFWFIN